ncbi:hypothetical protein RS85_03678 [Microbacterium sp. SA39]|nr:hypothetical protein RS85_03678 [Microbacterium sp. SA39]
MLTDLALIGRAEAEKRALWTRVEAIGDGAMPDVLLDPAWSYLAEKPRERRASLIERVRAALIDGETPDPRTAASIALLSASGTLPQFHAEIPCNGDVYTRGKELERGDWGAAAASSAVARTTNAVIANAVIAATVLPRN